MAIQDRKAGISLERVIPRQFFDLSGLLRWGFGLWQEGDSLTLAIIEHEGGESVYKSKIVIAAVPQLLERTEKYEPGKETCTDSFLMTLYRDRVTLAFRRNGESIPEGLELSLRVTSDQNFPQEVQEYLKKYQSKRIPVCFEGVFHPMIFAPFSRLCVDEYSRIGGVKLDFLVSRIDHFHTCLPKNIGCDPYECTAHL